MDLIGRCRLFRPFRLFTSLQQCRVEWRLQEVIERCLEMQHLDMNCGEIPSISSGSRSKESLLQLYWSHGVVDRPGPDSPNLGPAASSFHVFSLPCLDVFVEHLRNSTCHQSWTAEVAHVGDSRAILGFIEDGNLAKGCKLQV